MLFASILTLNWTIMCGYKFIPRVYSVSFSSEYFVLFMAEENLLLNNLIKNVNIEQIAIKLVASKNV